MGDESQREDETSRPKSFLSGLAWMPGTFAALFVVEYLEERGVGFWTQILLAILAGTLVGGVTFALIKRSQT